MKSIIACTFLSVILSCSSQESVSPTANREIAQESHPTEFIDSSMIDSVSLGLNFTPNGTYNSAKQQAIKLRNSGATGQEFEDHLLNEIIPHWYGTPWDFNGYTAIPNQGEIACGYFVSTTLLHMGISINRYHLAQQAGYNEAKSLAIDENNFRTIYGLEELQSTMHSEYQDGIYFVGLDNHVGYLYKKNRELYFIHSNYLENKVMLEKVPYSPAFESSIYVIAEISTNEALMDAWRQNKTVKVYRQ